MIRSSLYLLNGNYGKYIPWSRFTPPITDTIRLPNYTVYLLFGPAMGHDFAVVNHGRFYSLTLSGAPLISDFSLVISFFTIRDALTRLHHNETNLGSVNLLVRARDSNQGKILFWNDASSPTLNRGTTHLVRHNNTNRYRIMKTLNLFSFRTLDLPERMWLKDQANFIPLQTIKEILNSPE